MVTGKCRWLGINWQERWRHDLWSLKPCVSAVLICHAAVEVNKEFDTIEFPDISSLLDHLSVSGRHAQWELAGGGEPRLSEFRLKYQNQMPNTRGLLTPRLTLPDTQRRLWQVVSRDGTTNLATVTLYYQLDRGTVCL